MKIYWFILPLRHEGNKRHEILCVEILAVLYELYLLVVTYFDFLLEILKNRSSTSPTPKKHKIAV